MDLLNFKRSPILRWAKTRLDAVFFEPPPKEVLHEEPPVYKRALELCRGAETFAPGTSGEYKRHQVYSKLIKEFPEIARKDLGLIIEQAVRRL